MLKLIPEPTFKEDVEITVPGQEKTGTIPLTFKCLGRKEYLAFIAATEGEKDKKGKVVKNPMTVVEAFPEFVEGWDLAEDFTADNLEIFFNNYPAAYGEIIGAYSKLLFESRIKN